MSSTRHALVTGSSGGIGAAACRRLVEDGWTVTGLDRTPPAEGSPWRHLDADLADPVALAALDLQSPVTSIVHTAAVQVLGSAGRLSADDWQLTLQVNVLCLDQLVGRCLPDLRSVIAISSVHTEGTTREMAAYSTSKAALVGWVKAAALDLAPSVRVNAIQPGAILTPMLTAGFSRRATPEQQMAELAALAARTPLQSIGRPEDIAHLVAFLADDEASRFITGSVMRADGGALLGLATE